MGEMSKDSHSRQPTPEINEKHSNQTNQVAYKQLATPAVRKMAMEMNVSLMCMCHLFHYSYTG